MKKYPNISRTIAFLLVLAMLLPSISMTVFSQDNPCAEDGCSGKYRSGICSAAGHYEAAPAEGSVYRISNAGQLYWFAALVNAGENDADAVLTADITINADMNADEKLAWIPIGLYTSAREYVSYAGTFDGAGYTIYGLYYDNTAYDGRNAGLFGTLAAEGVVKNVTLADSVINGATEIGGIVAHNYGSVIGCTQSGTVSGTGATGGIVCRNMEGALVENCANTGAVTGATIGGIAAENNGEIVSCANSGVINGTNSVGGIVGMNDGSVEDSLNTANVTGANTHVGGVAGNHVGGEIVGCGNTGNVTGASDYIGGVAGVCSGAVITKSYNTGSVTGNTGKSDAVGGVVGAIDGTNTDQSAITSCYNTGAVIGRSWVGGIAGISGYQKTPQAVTFRNSYNTGSVSGSSYVGAVVGKLTKGTVSDTYFQQGSAQNSVSGATAATAAKFASGEIAYALNGSTSEGQLIWKQIIGTDASPKFTGAVVYFDSANGTYYNERCTHGSTETVRENERPATCTEGGSYVAVVRCVDCGEEISRQTVTVDALGHNFIDGECTRCHEKQEQPPVEPAENPFVDNIEGEFYYDAVLWGVKNGIVAGMDDTHFGPNLACNRAQVVTFLWRAAGRPEAKNAVNPFTDVKPGDYFYEAVLWGVEEGIVAGISADKFAPLAQCNRAQVVTFLWRAEGRPASNTAVSFSDVKAGQFYTTAVAWAVENKITSGIGNNLFGVTTICNRAQIITFLYRTHAN